MWNVFLFCFLFVLVFEFLFSKVSGNIALIILELMYTRFWRQSKKQKAGMLEYS